jgi:muramoyltetrapeptide carboxypeptidase
MLAARLPPALRPGDRVGVAALSGPIAAERLEAGLAALAALGFEPVPAANLAARGGLFAGRDADRLEAFHRLVDDPSVRAILFARGGHGLLRILPGIDWRRLARVPRAYVGYSDVTPFLLEVVRRLGWIAFHGPMVAADLAAGLESTDREALVGALTGEPVTEVGLAGALGAGVVRGPLLGGCLSLLAAALGTPWRARLDGALLAIEEVGEPLYRVDRMLTHLRLSGSLAAVRGILIGSMSGTEAKALEPSRVAELAAELAPGVPVAWGLPIGHGGRNLTLPLGAPARFDAAALRLRLELPGPVR